MKRWKLDSLCSALSVFWLCKWAHQEFFRVCHQQRDSRQSRWSPPFWGFIIWWLVDINCCLISQGQNCTWSFRGCQSLCPLATYTVQILYSLNSFLRWGLVLQLETQWKCLLHNLKAKQYSFFFFFFSFFFFFFFFFCMHGIWKFPGQGLNSSP